MQPGLLIALFHASAGGMVFAAAVGFLAAWHGHLSRLHFSFALMCLCAFGYQWATAELYCAPDVASASRALRVQLAAGLAFFPVFIAFIGLYTDLPHTRRWVLAATVVFGGMALFNLALPHGLRYATLEPAAPLRLPWGEVLYRYRGESSIWRVVVPMTTVASLGLAAWVTLRVARDGLRRQAVPLAACIALLAVAIVFGALVNAGLIEFVHVAGFAFLGMVAIMAVALVHDLKARNLALQRGSAALMREMEMRSAAEQRLTRMAFHDDVTGLPSRIALHQHLDAVLATDGDGALCLLDLDHFRIINDTLGHHVGDRVLGTLGERLQSLAGGQAFVARIGGDEFALVLPPGSDGADGADRRAGTLAERVAACVAEPVHTGPQVLTVGASIGIVTFARGAQTQDLLRHAEMALYAAKRAGRNTVQRYHADMQCEVDERLALEHGLREALDGDGLALHFQPLVRHDGSVLGAEALLRWAHPERGLVSPAVLVPIAEESGLIHPIGAWVLDCACAAVARWRAAEVPFAGTVSINVCAWELARRDYVDCVRETLARHRLPPSCLTLEITESSLLYDIDETAVRLADLRSLGVRIALDDFGTGYSSLAYLKDLPIDTLKIDRAFVRDTEHQRRHALVEAMVSIGTHLDLDVVAEGVETPQQRDSLLAMGCSRFQGFLYARPMPETEFVDWLRQRRRASA